MTRHWKCVGVVALASVIAVTAATPSQARHRHHHQAAVVAVATPPVFGGFSPGSYYSSIYNPRFGYCPELGYSNAVSFQIYPLCD